MRVHRAGWASLALLIGLLVVFGCGPSKEERAIEVYNRGITYEHNGEPAKAEADFAKARELGYEPE